MSVVQIPRVLSPGAKWRSPISTLLRPAVHLMNRLSYGPKFVVIGLVLLVPMAAVFLLQYRNMNNSIGFSEKELMGAEYLDKIEDFFFALENHRILAVAISAGATTLRDELQKTTEQVNSTAAALDAMDRRVGADDADHLGTSSKWREILSGWRELRQLSLSDPQKVDAEHQNLASEIKDGLILQACTRSNLILDPYSSAFWLADAIALKLPAISDALTAAATHGIIPIGDGMADRLVALSGLRYHALLSLDDLESKDLEMAYRDYRERHGTEILRWSIQNPFQQMNGQVTAQLEILKRHYFPVPADSLPAIQEASEQTRAALVQNHKLSRVIQPWIRQIIQERIRAFEQERLFGIVSSSLAGLFLVYLFTGFYLSVRTSISALSAATTRMIRGTTETFSLESRDELGQMAESYNRINTVLLQARALLEHSPDGIAVTRDSQLLYANGQMLNLLGSKDLSGLLGNPAPELFQGLSADGQLLERSLSRPDGERIHVEMASHEVLFEGAPAVMSIVRDITDRKRNEDIIADQRVRNARAAGRAEIATAVLHNVGNILNSVNVSINICGEAAKRSKTPGLAKAVTLMRAHQEALGDFLTKDSQGRYLPEYLAVLSEQLTSEQQSLQSELNGLQQNVSHLTSIIAAQQAFAKSAGVSEAVLPAEVFQEALILTSDRFERHGIQLVRQFEQTGLAIMERHKLIQILVNLLNNAVQAMTERDNSNHLLRLGLTQPSPDRIAFSVEDNGIGISSENKIRIFSHGFTTKKDGHGFGLHASACFASEMGGTLTCESKGLGLGSTFILELPFVKAGANRDYKLHS